MKNLIFSVVLLLTVTFAFAANDVEKVSTFDVEETLDLPNHIELANADFAGIILNETPLSATSNTMAILTCFDFYDSCGGVWEVCYEGFTFGEVVDILIVVDDLLCSTA